MTGPASVSDAFPNVRSSAADGTVLLQQTGAVLTLLLNRPEKRNAAGFDLQSGIAALLEEAAGIADAKALIISGVGPIFCAGGDLDDLKAMSEGTLANARQFIDIQNRIAHSLLTMPMPAIAAVNGAAAGFGAELVAMCDFVILGKESLLWDPHAQHGAAPSKMLQIVWPHLTSLAKCRDILMTGRKVTAAEAVDIGLASQMCPAGKELQNARRLAEVFAAMPSAGVCAAKARFNQVILADLHSFMRRYD